MPLGVLVIQHADNGSCVLTRRTLKQCLPLGLLEE